MLDQFLISHSESVSPFEAILNLIVSLLLILPVIWAYKKTKRMTPYNDNFLSSIFLFSALSCSITMVIGSNFARAFGLVGVLSIIRFRTALKSPLDAIFTFWSLTIGMSCGTGNYMLALITNVVCLISLFLFNIMSTKKNFTIDSIVKFSISESDFNEDNKKKISLILNTISKSHTITNTNYNPENKSIDYNVIIDLNDSSIDNIKKSLEASNILNNIEVTNYNSPHFFTA